MPPGDDATNLGYWRTFVAAATQHYASKSVAIEIWNEENTAGFWAALPGPDPARYARLLCAAHEGVRSVNSTIPVLFGGMSDYPIADIGHQLIHDYLNGAYTSGTDIRPCMEGIGVHAYPQGIGPDAPAAGLNLALDAARSARDANNDHAKPLWITEFGYATDPGQGTTVANQARWLRCGYQLAVGMPDVRSYIVHTLFDDTQDQAAAGLYYGVDTSPTVQKPAHGALKDLFATYGSNVPPLTLCPAP
jgi:hypothetical protein